MIDIEAHRSASPIQAPPRPLAARSATQVRNARLRRR
jgi:hypothetical protein